MKTAKQYFDKAAYLHFLTAFPTACRYFLLPLCPSPADKGTHLLLRSLWHPQQAEVVMGLPAQTEQVFKDNTSLSSWVDEA